MHFAAFADELIKISVSQGRMTVPKERAGRRPISVSNLLQKEKDSELYKTTGDTQKIANQVPFSVGPSMGSAAKPPRRKGDVPSREDMDALPKREDSRDFATTVPGTETLLNTDRGGT